MKLAIAGFALFFVLHVCGFREDVGFLSGTVPSTAASLAGGLAYAASWFFAVLVAPVLVLSDLTRRASRNLKELVRAR